MNEKIAFLCRPQGISGAPPEKRPRFDVSYSAADLGDDYVRVGLAGRCCKQSPLISFVIWGITERSSPDIAAALLVEHVPVHFTCREV